MRSPTTKPPFFLENNMSEEGRIVLGKFISVAEKVAVAYLVTALVAVSVVAAL